MVPLSHSSAWHTVPLTSTKYFLPSYSVPPFQLPFLFLSDSSVTSKKKIPDLPVSSSVLYQRLDFSALLQPALWVLYEEWPLALVSHGQGMDQREQYASHLQAYFCMIGHVYSYYHLTQKTSLLSIHAISLRLINNNKSIEFVDDTY